MRQRYLRDNNFAVVETPHYVSDIADSRIQVSCPVKDHYGEQNLDPDHGQPLPPAAAPHRCEPAVTPSQNQTQPTATHRRVLPNGGKLHAADRNQEAKTNGGQTDRHILDSRDIRVRGDREESDDRVCNYNPEHSRGWAYHSGIG